MKKYAIVFASLLLLTLPVDVLALAAGSTGFGYLRLDEQSSNPATAPSTKVYLFMDNTSTPVLKMIDDAGTVTSITAGSGDNTLNDAYDQGGAGAGRTITVDTGAVTMTNTDADATSLLAVTNNPSSSAAGDGVVITMGSNSTGDGIEFENTGSGSDIEGTANSWSVSKAGVAIFAGLTAATFSPVAITASGTFTLDDGTTDSPDFVMTDETDESATFTKVDSGYLTITTAAADGVSIRTGNLTVGNGSAGTAAMDGEDLYVDDELEVNGATTLDGAVSVTAAATFSGTTAFTGSTNIFTLGAAEYVRVDGATTAHTDTGGVLDINFGSTTTAASGINLYANLINNTGNEEVTGMFIDLDDDSDAAGELSGITIDATDTTGSSAIYGISFQAADGSATGVEQCIHAEPPAGGQYLVLDAVTAVSTQTSGVIDIDFATLTTAAMAFNLKTTLNASAGAGVEVTGMYFDIEDDSDSASTVTGITMDSTDATGSSEVRGIAFETIAGADTLIDTCIFAETDADTVVLKVDAAGTDHTGADGIIDLDYDSATAAAAAINVKVTHVAGGSGQKVAGIEIEVDSDADNGSDETYGLLINVTDATDTGTLTGIQIEGAGLDIGIQVDHGGIWIGTGGTADLTQGDDTLYAEGTGEFDGAVRLDGAVDVNSTITGAGTTATTIAGMTSIVENYTGADNVITIAESGSTFTNSGDGDGSLHTLPEASTCVGAEFTFLVVAGFTLTVNPDDADIILHLSLSTGDAISSSTANDAITLRAVSSSQWMVTSVYPLAADWADAN